MDMEWFCKGEASLALHVDWSVAPEVLSGIHFAPTEYILGIDILTQLGQVATDRRVPFVDMNNQAHAQGKSKTTPVKILHRGRLYHPITKLSPGTY